MWLKRKGFEFGEFFLDTNERVLLKNGKPVSITPKTFQLLLVLIENHGRIVEKDELMKTVWADSFVEEGNLTYTMRLLRKALADDSQNPRYIETVPRRGYRFIADVRETANDSLPENAAPSAVFQPVKKDSFERQRFRQFLFPTFIILIVSLIATGFWYSENKTGETDAPVLSAPFASEKLSTNGKVAYAVISSDGKNVIYTNELGGKQSVWIRQLESGNNVQIIPPSDEVYYGLALSPNGNFLYFSRKPRNIEGQADIYRVSIFGGVPAKIVSEAQGWMSISPDGEQISFVRCYYQTDENCSLWTADSSDGENERKLVSRQRPYRIGDNQISPDGRSVAFAVGQSENSANEFSLVEVDIESGEEREMTAQKFFNIKSVAWLPNRNGLLLTARTSHQRNFRIWHILPETREAFPLTNDSEIYSALSINQAASLIVSTQVKRNAKLLHFQTDDPSVKEVLADAAGGSFAPDKKIVYSSDMTGNSEIWSINADGSEQRQLTNDAAEDNKPVVSHDGNFIYFTSNRTGEAHVWRMNADGSDQTQITKNAGGFSLSVSPDGNRVFYQHGKNRTLWSVSTKDGAEVSVLEKEKYHFALSPDGLYTAYSEKQGEERILMIVSLADKKTAKTFPTPVSKSRILEIAFLPDRKSIAYTLSSDNGENNTLWFQPLDGGTAQKIADLGGEEISSLAFAPDGKSFTVVEGSWIHDAVLLKGLK